MGQWREDKATSQPTVLVLMSTYNGERFLAEQLESIFAQKGCMVKILVRDDGSTDSTKGILGRFFKENIATANRNGILDVTEGDNIGAARSFFYLLNMAMDTEYHYFALADQDDIWMPDKLVTAVARIREAIDIHGKDMPCLYASAVRPVDGEGRPLPAGICYKEIRPSFGNALVENICTGCTCVMNRRLLSVIKGKTPGFAVMHDFWLYLLASAFGEVLYDKQPHILYRQHGGNSVGMASTVFENYKRRILNFRKHRGELKHQAEEFRCLYEKDLRRYNKEKANLLQEFQEGKRRLIWGDRVYRQRKSDNLIMKLFLLFGCL